MLHAHLKKDPRRITVFSLRKDIIVWKIRTIEINQFNDGLKIMNLLIAVKYVRWSIYGKHGGQLYTNAG